MFVHSSLYDRFVEESVKRARSIKLGHSLDLEAEQGPQISRKQMERVLGYIQKGLE